MAEGMPDARLTRVERALVGRVRRNARRLRRQAPTPQRLGSASASTGSSETEGRHSEMHLASNCHFGDRNEAQVVNRMSRFSLASSAAQLILAAPAVTPCKRAVRLTAEVPVGRCLDHRAGRHAHLQSKQWLFVSIDS